MWTPNLRTLGAVALLCSVVAVPSARADTCTTSTNTYNEGFGDQKYRDTTTSATGWGEGAVKLALKGNTFNSSSQNVGEKIFVVGAADFDGDGWIDMAAVMLSPDRLHFLKNSGINSDGSHKGFSTGGAVDSSGWKKQIIDDNIPDFNTSAPSLIAGDFDGDGDPDLLYMKTGTQDNAGSVIRAFVYRLDNVASGIPKFTRIELTSFFQTYRVSWHWTANFSQAVDWDKDGKADLVAGSSWGTTNKVMLFKAAKTGIGFQAPIDLVANVGFQSPFADTSATASGGSTCVPPAVSGFKSRGVSSLAVDDFDLDGDLDVIVGSLSEKNLKFWTNDGADVMTRAADIPFSAGAPTFLLAGDLDGDGDTDLTVGRDGYNCGGSGGTVWFFANDGKGNFTPRTDPILSSGSDLDFGAAFYVDENVKYPELNTHTEKTMDVIAADGNDKGSYDEILSQRYNVYNLSGSAISTVIDSLDDSTNAIVAVTMIGLKQSSSPPTTSVTYAVSNDGGANWETLTSDETYKGARPAAHTFTHFGSDFRFRADLATTESTLSGAEAALAPGSKQTPTVDEIVWEYEYVKRREYSRSALAYASDLKISASTTKDVVFSSTFFYPGFEGTLTAYDQAVALTTTNEANNDLNQVVVKSGVGNAVIWDAGAKLKQTSGASRTIYTAIPDNDGVVNTRQYFSSGNASALASYMATDETTAATVINFIRNGMGSNDGTKLYDVGHSSPVYVGPLDPANIPADVSLTADNYAQFATAQQSRLPTVYIGANSGMVHAFDAQTGNERWAFVPYNLLAKLKLEMGTDKDGNKYYDHQYMVDGAIIVRDVYDRKSAQWRTILIGGEALGTGRADENYYFALDVTDPTKPQPLWEFTDAWSAANTSCTGETKQTVCTTVPETTCTGGACDVTNHQAAPGKNGAIIMEAELYNAMASLDSTHSWVLAQTENGSTGSGYMQVSPSDGTSCSQPSTTCGTTMDYSLQSASREYEVWIRYQTVTKDAKIRFRIGSLDETGNLSNKKNGWSWYKSSSNVTLTAGDQTLTIFMINDWVLIDRIMLVPKGGNSGGNGGGGPSGDTDQPTCADVCTTDETHQSCTTQSYPADGESFECGIGSNMKCCKVDTEYYCAPIAKACDDLDTVTGETWSTPVVAPVRISSSRTWLVFFGSGYNNRQGLPAAVGRSVYAIDAVSGTLRSRWDYNDLAYDQSANPSTIDNTIPGGVAVFDYTTTGTDPTPDGFADVAYVGDLEGRLWKIDLHPSASIGGDGQVSSTIWPTCELFDAGDPDRSGTRNWAPIITTPAVTTIKQDTTATSYLPYVYFGTGGDDRAPSTLLYRFYAVKDTVTCPTSTTPTTTTAIRQSVIYSDTSHLQWIVGDGKNTSGSPLTVSDAEGTNGQRYWSDPTIYNNAIIYFASLDGSIESVNPCDNLSGGSLLYGYAIHDFFSGAVSIKAGTSTASINGGATGSSPYYRSASKIRRTAMVATQAATAGVAQPANTSTTSSAATQVYIQTFDGNVRSITPPTVNDVNTIRVLRWREIPLY